MIFKVPSEGNTELAQIGATFNFMTGKIKEQIESLSNINRTQKQLIGSLAHELKTPMTANHRLCRYIAYCAPNPRKAGEGSDLY